MRKLLLIVTLVLSLAMLSATAFAQSRIPKEINNWMQTTGLPINGDVDGVVVVFFEVPDSSTSTLYFGVNDAGSDATHPDFYDGTPPYGFTDFYLVGGAGTVSDPNSRLIDYSADTTVARTGTVLDTFTADETGPYNDRWVYFSGVLPNEGEHIGNKYYFKIVAEADADIGKNAFQFDISTSNSGAPTGITGVRSFAYMWTLAFDDTIGKTWEIFPFVPEDASGDIEFRNWDADSGENMTAFDISGNNKGAVTSSGQGTSWPADQAMSNFSIGTERGGTWKLEVVETALPAYINTTELWHTNSMSGEVYRTYSSCYVPSSPDHVVLTVTDGLAQAGVESETVYVQLVDSSGNSQSFIRDIYITVSGSAQINNASNTSTGLPSSAALVTADSDGFAWVTVDDGTTEICRVDAVTDGSDILPGTNVPAYINFHGGGLGALDHILITDAPDGNEVTSLDILTDQTVYLYASGYDASNAFRSLVNVMWDSTGSLDTVSKTGTILSFSQSNSGSGTITADDGQGHTDATGIITILSTEQHFSLRNNIIDPRKGDMVSVFVVLSSSQKIRAKVYDLAGNLVKTLADKTYAAGTHSITWDGKSRRGRPVVPDVYFIVVTVNGTRKVFKVLVVK